jgi:hypothetical protein
MSIFTNRLEACEGHSGLIEKVGGFVPAPSQKIDSL